MFKSKCRAQMTVFAFLFFSAKLFAQTKPNIIGRWVAKDDSYIEMEVYLGPNHLYYTKIVADEKKGEDVGKIMIKNIIYNSKTNSYNGIMNPPDANLELSVTLSLENSDKLKILIKKLFISRTIYFTRIKNE